MQGQIHRCVSQAEIRRGCVTKMFAPGQAFQDVAVLRGLVEIWEI
jgi:hypothetical protein